MKLLRIVLLHAESVFEQRLRSFVWFLVVFVNPMLYILFWTGAPQNVDIVPGWNVSAINGYYLLLVVAFAFLLSHIEEDVSYFDIQQGELDRYLVKPFSYFRIKLIESLPYRILQGIYALIAVGIVYLFIKDHVVIHITPESFSLGILTGILAFLMWHTYKMCLGLLAFWITDMKGMFDLLDVIRIVLCGGFMPLALYPDLLKTVADILPFSYGIYYPVIVLQGQATLLETAKIVGIQALWVIALYTLYTFLWRRGIASFTGVGK